MKKMSSRVKKDRELKKLREAYSDVGAESEDYGWRSLTQMADRDLTPLVQKRMQEIAFYLYDSNPMAHRILELTKDFVVGDGFRYQAKDDGVQKILDKHWKDSDNAWGIKQDSKVLELGLWGEQCYPVFVNEHTGHVKLGYLDPGLIVKVRLDKNNPEITKNVEWAKGNRAIRWKVVNLDRRQRSKSQGYLEGECFYFGINKVVWSSRGRSDLLCIADWIDGYDQFLFARLERAFYLNNFIWDVKCDGMARTELQEFAKEIKPPKPGSVRVHNEKIMWDVVNPKLEAADASQEAKLFKNQILGGAGYPGHWFAEGEKTTRATAMEMGLPTLKKLRSRQKFVRNMIERIFNFVIDQAMVHGMLDKKVDRSFTVIPSPIITKEARGLALTLEKFASAMKIAVDSQWISDKTAKSAFQTFISDLGIELRELEELEKEDNIYKDAKGR